MLHLNTDVFTKASIQYLQTNHSLKNPYGNSVGNMFSK